jgi:Zn-dependent protease with chaperone function
MSEMTATRKWPAWGAATIAVLVAVVWIVAGALLWGTSVPGSLHVPKLDPRDYFSASELARTARYERFVRIDLVLSLLATIAALAVLARRAPRLARNTGLGPIGAGMIVGMITLAVVWAANLPFAVAARWWEQRHGLAKGPWIAWLLDPWAELGGAVVFVMLQIAIVMVFARRYPRHWWLPVTPIFLGLATLALFVSPYLFAFSVDAPKSPQLRQDVQTLERREGITGTPVDVEKVSDLTTQANAFAAGLGPTTRVVIFDTLLDGRFSRGEIRVVLAHEFGHVARGHLWKGIGWAALFAFPFVFAVAQITRRRGGLGDPGVLPYGVLVLVLLQVAFTPAQNVVSRHTEAEADWVALETTRDPAAARGLFERFSETSLAEPNPPTWSYIFFETHPTLMQRIAMAEAWKTRVNRSP